MRKFKALVLALALVLVSAVPASAHACDPGRTSNTADSKAWVERFGGQVSRVSASIEVDRPFLESGQWENQFIELRNGSFYARLGINYTAGIGTRIFTEGTGLTTMYHTWNGSSAVDATVRSFEIGQTRIIQFQTGGTILRTQELTSGRWTPNEVELQVFSSNLGNGIVGHPGNVAYFLNADWASNQYGVLDVYNSSVSVWRTTNFPGTASGDANGFYTRDSC